MHGRETAEENGRPVRFVFIHMNDAHILLLLYIKIKKKKLLFLLCNDSQREESFEIIYYSNSRSIFHRFSLSIIQYLQKIIPSRKS